ncbi:MAG: hypothetical protein PHY14_00320 [Candidatus Gracilibacteria bacterium]|nr:hypothetical protein [Candidatus Gracilibacteria bacterium]
MSYFALFCLAFGGIIIAYPQFLAYLIGFFFIFVGLNSLFFSIAMMQKKANDNESRWSIGGYEIIRKRK